MVDRNLPIPIYYQLKSLLKEQIQEGSLRPGDQLPTEQEICARYAISRAPVRHALAELVQEGWVYRRAGQGTFVASVPAALPIKRDAVRLLAYDVCWVTLLERAIQRWNMRTHRREVMLDVDMPSPLLFHGVLRDAVGAGEAPDLVSIDYVWMHSYARGAYLAALEDISADWARQITEDLETPVLHSHRVDGKLYGIPIQADVTGMWYRRDWFAEEGLAPPDTWDEWLMLIDYFARPEIRARFGHRYPVVFPIGTETGEAVLNLLLPFFWAAGGDLLDESGAVVLETSEVYETLRYLRSITMERHCLPPEVVHFDWTDIPRLLAQGATPMTVGGSYEWHVLCESSPWEEAGDILQHFAFAPIPRPARDGTLVSSLGGTTWGVMRQSAQQKLIFELARLALSPELSVPFCLDSFQLSPLRSVNAQLAAQNALWMEQVLPLLHAARPRPLVKGYVQISSFFQQMIQQVLWEAAPVEETVRQAARSIRLLQRSGSF